jgi:polyribonucleotide nucleotidyltransferase
MIKKGKAMQLRERKLAVGGKEITFQTGKYCEQANACVTAQLGDTLVMGTVTKGNIREGIDFFPLSVDFEEKLYAGGIIKSSRYIKREGRPSDDAILKGRLIDRSIRPLFNKESRNDIQVVVTVLSFDEENSPEIIGALAVYAALTISDLPWAGPLACLRLGYLDGEYLINPTYTQRAASKLDLIISGKKDKILMLEAGCLEVPEDVMAEGMDHAMIELANICGLMDELREEWGVEKTSVEMKEEDTSIEERHGDAVRNLIGNFLLKFGQGEATRHDFGPLVEEKALESVDGEENVTALKDFIDTAYKKAMRRQILQEGKRPDGRELDEVRQLTMEAGLVPRVHGSSMFKRGGTQVLNILTLGPPSLEQRIEGMEGSRTKRYFHHYSAPPYSVGETGRIGGPGRREIGHGALAEKAIMPVLPDDQISPYTIRSVSEVLSQNGSSSMASVCASTLSLMDAGIKIKRPVAGIAIGLVTDEASGDFKTITDIAGIEDFGGDMDFKVAGTREGITAIQMDTKTHGISLAVAKETLERAKKARLFILDEMSKLIASPRQVMSPHAPKIESVTIDRSDIGKVIGSGGSVIRRLSQEFEVVIDVDEEGVVTVVSSNEKNLSEVKKIIKGIVDGPDVGEIYDGKVVRLMDFGAFVEILPGVDGLVHISHMSKERIDRPHDVVSEGDEVKVKLFEIDNMGRLNLTMNLSETPQPRSRRPGSGGSDGSRSRPRRPSSGGRPRPRGR